jgi:hypothetical protein
MGELFFGEKGAGLKRRIGYHNRLLLMKVLGLAMGAILTLGFPCRAQTIDQLVEQLALDTQKLTQMKSMLSDMRAAYTLIDKGYSEVKEIAKGNFDLHKTFLDGLLLVSPEVRNYKRVVDIINSEASLVKESSAARSRFRADGHFTVAELDYLGSLYDVFLQHGLDRLSELAMILTDGQLRMSDAERLGAVDRVWAGTNSDLGLLRTLNNSTSLQTMQRQGVMDEVSGLKKFYGIN